MSEAMREAFEAWALKRYGNKFSLDEYNEAVLGFGWDAWQAALSGAQQGEAEPVAWAVFADNGNIRIWGREKPAGFPDAVPMYLSPTVKDLLTVQIDPIGYADPDTLSDYRAGDRLHIPVYRPDASAEWQAGIPVYLHAAPQPAQVPEGWKLVPIDLTADMREAFHEASDEWEDGGLDSPDHQWDALLCHAPAHPMLTAAPSGDAKREAEIKAEALEEYADQLDIVFARAQEAGAGNCPAWHAGQFAKDARKQAARLRQSDSGDDSEEKAHG